MLRQSPRRFLSALLLATAAQASPTSADFLPCEQMATAILPTCKTDRLKSEDDCRAQVEHRRQSCIATVMKFYAEPDAAQVQAQRQAAEAAEATLHGARPPASATMSMPPGPAP